jgi:hypothetical protein
MQTANTTAVAAVWPLLGYVYSQSRRFIHVAGNLDLGRATGLLGG